MESLPVEIIEHILSHDNLTIKEILSFSSTCLHFHDVVYSSKVIWKTIYLRRWPRIICHFEPNETVNFLAEIKLIYSMLRKAHSVLVDMSPKFYKRYELSDADLIEWKEMMNEYPRAYYYLIDKLMNIVNEKCVINSINVVPIDTPGNLTYQYYANIALRYIRQQHLSKEWEYYMSLPADEQILERGATLIAQWCHPTKEIPLDSISKQLDEIADEVRLVLQTINKGHPIFSTPTEVQDYWKTHVLPRNQWTAYECRQVMEAMGIVLYKQHGFHGDKEMNYTPENSCINEVLEKKRGRPITLAIIYESIARRLGIKSETISFPAHFLLRWTYESDHDESFYIDVYNNGQVIKCGACPGISYEPGRRPMSNFMPNTAKEVMERIAINFEQSGRHHNHPNGRITRLRSVLELLRLINPMNLTCMLNLARLYMLYNMDVSDLTSSLMNQEFDYGRRGQARQIVQMLQDHEAHHKNIRGALYPQVEAAPRTPELKFAVGMVMRHLGLHYTCVIYDWDPVCLASPNWQEQMNVNSLKLKDQQPFYNVLVDDGSHRYVAQENLITTYNAGILHMNEDIGRHFSHFYKTHFVPNAEKEDEYPADKGVRHMFYNMNNGHQDS